MNWWPSVHHSNALPTELSRNLLKWAFLFTFWTLFISRINRVWLYKYLNDSHRQPNSDLAQVIEHKMVMDSNSWGQFLKKIMLFCETLDLSGNLTEMHIAIAQVSQTIQYNTTFTMRQRTKQCVKLNILTQYLKATT